MGEVKFLLPHSQVMGKSHQEQRGRVWPAIATISQLKYMALPQACLVIFQVTQQSAANGFGERNGNGGACEIKIRPGNV